MPLKVLAIYDRKTESFGVQFIVVRTVGAAQRIFADEIQRDGSMLKLHPEDYDLYLLAEFDETDGRLAAVDMPKRMSQGTDHVS